MTMTERGVQRIRHPLKLRVLKVTGVRDITPRMRRISLGGADLEGFVSAAYDDHVKVFFPRPGEPLVMPEAGPNGLIFPEGQRPEARDYTPRIYDAAAGRLDLDFVLHGDGPAASWAAQAQVGQELGVGGPRGSFVVTGDYDYYLLVGDDTALPAIGRRIEELPAGATVIARIEVDSVEEEQKFMDYARIDIAYVHRSSGKKQALYEAVAALTLPEGVGYHFIAGEANMSKAIRALLVEARGVDPDLVKAAGYWHAGERDFDDGHAH